MGNLGAPELLIILLIVFIFFGAKKIPEMAQGIGKGIREFRKASREIQSDQEDEHVAELKSPKGENTSCFYCGAQVAKDARFCPSCGKSLESPTCAKCHTVNPLGTKFCSNCGEKL